MHTAEHKYSRTGAHRDNHRARSPLRKNYLNNKLKRWVIKQQLSEELKKAMAKDTQAVSHIAHIQYTFIACNNKKPVPVHQISV